MSRSFTLVEIMVVVGIIALLAAISIPNLLRARVNANEASAIASVKTVVTAQTMYRTSNIGFAGNLSTLSSAIPQYIDSALGSGNKQGYTFNTSGNTVGFLVWANPVSSSTGVRSFCSSEAGVINFSNSTYNGSSCTGTIIGQ